MTDHISNPSPDRDARQAVLRKKMNSHLDAVAKAKPTSAQMRYAQSVATEGDWIVQELATQSLPYSLTQLISIASKDLGNQLLEETLELNNRFAGIAFRQIEAQLAGDPACIDLQQRIIDWSEDVAAQVLYKMRNRVKASPIDAFNFAYFNIVSPLDTQVVHGTDRLFMLLWDVVVDMLPFKFWDEMIARPGHMRLEHDIAGDHFATLIQNSSAGLNVDIAKLNGIISLYGIEADTYLHNIVLAPLLRQLDGDQTLPGPDQQREKYAAMFLDILEAAPYLIASDRSERFIFELPGQAGFGAFQFTAGQRCAQMVFSDTRDRLLNGLRTATARCALIIGYDGSWSSYMHPWRTLEKVYGREHAQLIAYWMLSQVHDRITSDYLKIERYFLHAEHHTDGAEEQEGAIEETLAFVALAKAAPGNILPEEGCQEGERSDAYERFALPALRRQYFFKLLALCGARIEQGKGSEIKLLRDGARPFRLGNHYGNNPTIPAFLASNILKRLAVSRDEWLNAISEA